MNFFEYMRQLQQDSTFCNYWNTGSKDRQKAYTLLELLVVIAMVGLLTSVIIASLSSAKKQNDIKQKINNLGEIQLALERYRADNGQYPDDIYTDANFSSPAYIADVPTDPTADDEKYAYETPSDASGFCLAGGIDRYLDEADGIDCSAEVPTAESTTGGGGGATGDSGDSGDDGSGDADGGGTPYSGVFSLSCQPNGWSDEDVATVAMSGESGAFSASVQCGGTTLSGSVSDGSENYQEMQFFSPGFSGECSYSLSGWDGEYQDEKTLSCS